jgi:hypothetical protein
MPSRLHRSVAANAPGSLSSHALRFLAASLLLTVFLGALPGAALAATVPDAVQPAGVAAAAEVVSVRLSRPDGLPGQHVTLTVTNPDAVASAVPLAVQLHDRAPWPVWPCNAGGSRYLGELRRATDGSAALTFTVPNVARGVYYLVASTPASPCRQLGAGPTPAEFEVLPRVAVHLPDPELVTPLGRIGPTLEDCATWQINGGLGADDCAPYEYGPTEFPPTVVAPGEPVVFGISPDWHYDTWTLSGIAESKIEGKAPPEGQRVLASGTGGTRTISAVIPRLAGRWRLLLTYHASRGTNAVTVDRPAVFRIDFRNPSAPAPVSSDPQIFVAVFGSVDAARGGLRDVPGDFLLDVGATEWRVGSGGAMAAAFHALVRVRLLRADTCATVVNFIATPGSHWVIRFPLSGGDPTVEDWTDLGWDTGAMIQPAQSSHCALPSTDTVAFGREPIPDASRALDAVLIGIALLALAALGWRLPRRQAK